MVFNLIGYTFSKADKELTYFIGPIGQSTFGVHTTKHSQNVQTIGTNRTGPPMVSRGKEEKKM